jgi:hypothetical protein
MITSCGTDTCRQLADAPLRYWSLTAGLPGLIFA